jgi:hypothetical protein
MKETCGRFKNASGRLFALPLFAVDGGAECQSDLAWIVPGAPSIAHIGSRRWPASRLVRAYWIAVVGKIYLWITALEEGYLRITVVGKRYMDHICRKWISLDYSYRKNRSGSQL